jgi:hypothetical protein
MAEAVAAPQSSGAQQARLNQSRALSARSSAIPISPSLPAPQASSGGGLAQLRQNQAIARSQRQSPLSREEGQTLENEREKLLGGLTQRGGRAAATARKLERGEKLKAREKAIAAKAVLSAGVNNPVVARRINTFVWTILGAETFFIVPLIVFNLEMFWGYYGAKKKSKVVPALTWENIDGGKYLKFLPNLFLHASLLALDFLLMAAVVISLFVQIIAFFMPVIIAGGVVAVVTGTVNVPPALLNFFKSFIGL